MITDGISAAVNDATAFHVERKAKLHTLFRMSHALAARCCNRTSSSLRNVELDMGDHNIVTEPQA